MQSVPEDVHHHLYCRREEVHKLAGELQNDSWSEAVKVTSSFLVIQENISRRKSDALDIDLADLQEVREEEFVTVNCERTNSFSRYQFCAEEEGFGSFYDNLLSNSRRYVSLFAEAADELMPRRASDLMDEDDTFDILLQQVKTLGSLSSRHISNTCCTERKCWGKYWWCAWFYSRIAQLIAAPFQSLFEAQRKKRDAGS